MSESFEVFQAIVNVGLGVETASEIHVREPEDVEVHVRRREGAKAHERREHFRVAFGRLVQQLCYVLCSAEELECARVPPAVWGFGFEGWGVDWAAGFGYRRRHEREVFPVEH